MRTNVAQSAAVQRMDKKPARKRKLKAPEDTQVVVPASVDVPLPKPRVAQIAVPASINGRDLSEGKP